MNSREVDGSPAEKRTGSSYAASLQALWYPAATSTGISLEEVGSSRRPEAPISAREISEALDDARKSTARVYNITHLPRSNMNVCVLGCQGSTGEDPKKVAAKINEFAKSHPELKPDLIILLGDNFYPDGVFNPVDPRFESQFHGIYGNPELTEICSVPCVVVLGNHDGGRDTETQLKSWVPGHNYLLGTNPHSNDEAELQQVAHSMLRHPSDPLREEKKSRLFQQDVIDYRHLPKHLMPHFYHSWVFNKFQVFALNSNTYAKDFLELMRLFAFDKEIDPSTNQAAWLEQAYAQAATNKRATLFTMHHPLFSVGKRVYSSGWDAKHYLNPGEITLLNRILQIPPRSSDFKERLKQAFLEPLDLKNLDTNANYNAMLAKIIYDFQGLQPSMISTAHDHSIYVYNNAADETSGPKVCQIVAGGGGSNELQHRLYFGKQKNLGCFMREHGFAILSCDTTKPELFNINVVTTRGYHLQFTSRDSKPVRMETKDERVAELRGIVLQACGNYVDFLHEKQTETDGGFFNKMPPLTSIYKMLNYNRTHTQHDVDCMHEMMNFFNQFTPSEYGDTIIFLHSLMENLQNKDSDHSLYLVINTKLQMRYGKSIDQLHEEVLRTALEAHHH
ncbi:hypothetical protein AQUSIP_01550 [Aquicella siphonis]|uniref:Calcineurin-like phosphoesterase domain-containing protein n=1 Tax=Aquicella siphonis TaxID=254247 RepID=A0A5E4PEU1_9COXI|nr:metallophosphoesterase [Aquicella siphonis]VVC74881.1 hypothetical protein AQUSIP_01550 [Aquicella siphonis]